MRNSGKQGKNGMSKGQTKADRNDLEADVDALFRLPLAEFTGARNALAARLKKSARESEKEEAARVKALAKPSISAWAVNQLYWNQREEFDQLIASGERFHKAQTSRSAGKVADIRAALDARRESLTNLSDLAASVLRDAGHNPAPDTIRRITTTLEGISAYASRSDAPRPGRLTGDVDPPGFESFGSFPGAGVERQKAGGGRQAANVGRQKAGGGRQKANDQKQEAVAGRQSAGITQSRDKRQLEDDRKVKIAAARISLREAKRSLADARSQAKSLEGLQKRALAKAKEAEKNSRDAEERLEKAKATAEEAARRARSVAVEVEEAATAVEEASRKVEGSSQELERLFGE